MNAEYNNIAEHYLRRLITGPKFFSSVEVKETALLYPPFFDKLQLSIAAFNKKYPAVEVVFVSTYRSNTLQLIHYNNGASGIKKNGMHHYGIAADLAFKINGKFTYNGDYNYLRDCHKKQGLFLIAKNDVGHVQFIPVNAITQNALRSTVTNAVIEFQKQHKLKPDGIPGKFTIAKAKEVFK
jgi:hypothetical protein